MLLVCSRYVATIEDALQSQVISEKDIVTLTDAFAEAK